MTDRELLEKAARAAGLTVGDWLPGMGVMRYDRTDGVCSKHRWNPLIDDGDAFRLSVKLGIHISPDCEHETSGPEARAATPSAAHLMQEKHKGDKYAATRRAIVRAAAALAGDA